MGGERGMRWVKGIYAIFTKWFVYYTKKKDSSSFFSEQESVTNIQNKFSFISSKKCYFPTKCTRFIL